MPAPVQGGRLFGIAVFATAVGFYALAWLGLASPADAALFLVAVALTGQRIRPFLLVLAASVQDAPGLSYIWSYACFAAIAALLVGTYVLRRLTSAGAPADATLERLALFALVVVAYATLLSGLQSRLDGYAQSAERPYLLVGGLMAVMIVTGTVASAVIGPAGRDRRRLGLLAIGALAHALAVGVLQVPFGQAFYRSGENLAKVELSRQLVEEGALGFARINGPFLSPNAFGYTVLLLALVAVVVLWRTARVRAFLTYAVAGAAAVLLSLSKALLGYYGLAVLVLFRYAAGRLAAGLAVFAGAAAVAAFASTRLYDLLLAVFRVQEGSLGSRQVAWLAVLSELQPLDWLFGVGLSAWPVFFEDHVGIALSDPHSLPLSVAGTFGIVGVLFYLLLVTTLLKSLRRARDDADRVAVLLLLLLFFLKDLVSIPAVLGNTPLTFLVWLLLGLSIARWTTVPSAQAAPLPAPAPG